MNEPIRSKQLARWSSLDSEFSSWRSHYQELSQYLLPRSGRFFVSDVNRGNKRHNAIYDSTGTKALSTLAAGMMAGVTSPARPWFRLATPDQDLMKFGPVKVWLNDVTRLMLNVFAKSNSYRALHQVYEELGCYGTASTILLDDYQDVVRHYSLTAGEYRLAAGHRGDVNTLYRQFQKTVAQMVDEFGIENVSRTVKNMYDRGNLDAWVTVIHLIEPRSDRDPTKRDAKNMAWKSVYFEQGSDTPEKVLRESGMNDFRALCPRWKTSGGDIYGESPGMMALGDIKQLQHEQLRKSQGIDYMTKPPLQMPASAKNHEVDTLPGGISFVDQNAAHGGIRSAFEVNLNLQYLLEDIRDVRERVNGAFYADLFLMLANSGRDTRMTATEVAERHEEKMLALGPVLERLHDELLDPLIDITFARMLSAGIVPPPPPELHGVQLDVEFVSMLAQAQRAIGINGIDRYTMGLGMVAQMKPDVLDRFDADQWTEIYSDSLGVDPRLVVADDKVAIIRADRAKAQQAMQQAALMAQGAQTAATMANAPTGEQNLLTDATAAFSGYT